MDLAAVRSKISTLIQAHGVMVHPDGVLSGGADPRGDGMALGV